MCARIDVEGKIPHVSATRIQDMLSPRTSTVHSGKLDVFVNQLKHNLELV